jgi:lipopolysaccharide biosynthesis protein
MQLLRNYARRLRLGLGKMLDAVHWIIGNLRRMRNYVRRTWPGRDPNAGARDEAVYLHFDRRGDIHDYVIQQLTELREAGFRITFVSNSPKFRNSHVADIEPFCRQIVWRRNVGYDFGGYKDGIRSLGNLDAIDRLIVMNDSAYGPFYSLRNMINGVDGTKTDCWGITESWEHHYHVQSYFMLFFRGALSSVAFRQFWRRFPYVNRKAWVIRYGEIKLSQILAQRKLRVRVLAPYWEVAKHVLDKMARIPSDVPEEHKSFLNYVQSHIVLGHPLNPSHYFWETLILDFGSPFLKREVITSNPTGSPFNWRWAEVIARNSNYDPGLIVRHLQTQ